MKKVYDIIRDWSLGNLPTMLKSFHGMKRCPLKINFLRFCRKASGGDRSKGGTGCPQCGASLYNLRGPEDVMLSRKKEASV